MKVFKPQFRDKKNLIIYFSTPKQIKKLPVYYSNECIPYQVNIMYPQLTELQIPNQLNFKYPKIQHC